MFSVFLSIQKVWFINHRIVQKPFSPCIPHAKHPLPYDAIYVDDNPTQNHQTSPFKTRPPEQSLRPASGYLGLSAPSLLKDPCIRSYIKYIRSSKTCDPEFRVVPPFNNMDCHFYLRTCGFLCKLAWINQGFSDSRVSTSTGISGIL